MNLKSIHIKNRGQIRDAYGSVRDTFWPLTNSFVWGSAEDSIKTPIYGLVRIEICLRVWDSISHSIKSKTS